MQDLTTHNSFRQAALIELLSCTRNPLPWVVGDVLQSKKEKKALYLVTKVIDKWTEEGILFCVQEIDNNGSINPTAWETTAPDDLFDFDIVGHISHKQYQNLECLIKGYLKQLENQ